jgi:hypothetical protein
MTAHQTPVLDWSARARRAASNRFLQFVLIGGAMFALAPASGRREVVSVEQKALAAFADADTSSRLTGARGPDIAQRFIEDEVLYREGLRLGFDKDDGIVRQRVVQKVLFLAEEVGGASRPPTDDELRIFHRDHPDRFRRQARIRFRHLFAREAAALPAMPERVWPRGGQPAPVGPEMEADVADIEEALGPGFTASLVTFEPGDWRGPLRSSYGWHVVKILSRSDARPLTFEEARAEVVEQYSVFRRQEAIAAYLSKALAKYRIEIDGQPTPAPTPSRRLAMRGVPSPED